MTKKTLLLFVVLIAVICGVLFVTASSFAYETDPLKNLGTAGSGYGTVKDRTLPQLVGTYVNAFLSLLGVIFVILLIYGGTLFMTASGDTTKSKKGMDVIRQAAIGLIIVVSAFAISNFVITYLATGQAPTSTPAPTASPAG